MVHPILLMPAIQMNQLPVRELLFLSTHLVPPIISTIIVLPSPICASIVVFIVSPSAHATPPLLVIFSSYPLAFM